MIAAPSCCRIRWSTEYPIRSRTREARSSRSIRIASRASSSLARWDFGDTPAAKVAAVGCPARTVAVAAFLATYGATVTTRTAPVCAQAPDASTARAQSRNAPACRGTSCATTSSPMNPADETIVLTLAPSSSSTTSATAGPVAWSSTKAGTPTRAAADQLPITMVTSPARPTAQGGV